MGFGGISIWQLLIVLAIIILLFGTKRLRSFGSDLGSAVKGFRKSMDDSEQHEDEPNQLEEKNDEVIQSSAEKVADPENAEDKEKK